MPDFSRGSFGGPNFLLDGVYSFNPYKPSSRFAEHRHANSTDPDQTPQNAASGMRRLIRISTVF